MSSLFQDRLTKRSQRLLEAILAEATYPRTLYQRRLVHDVLERHKYPQAKNLIHYAFSVVYTQPVATIYSKSRDELLLSPERKNRSILECHKLLIKFAQLMCQTFVAKRDYRRKSKEKFFVSAFYEDKDKFGAATHAHHHGLLSIHKEFAPVVDEFCRENCHKKFHLIDRVLPREIMTSDLVKLKEQQDIETWLFYSVKHHRKAPSSFDAEKDTDYKISEFYPHETKQQNTSSKQRTKNIVKTKAPRPRSRQSSSRTI